MHSGIDRLSEVRDTFLHLSQCQRLVLNCYASLYQQIEAFWKKERIFRGSSINKETYNLVEVVELADLIADLNPLLLRITRSTHLLY